jgi:hypothetical protein
MSSDLVRYLATSGAITLCGSVAHVISLKMALRFNCYVVDRAVDQGQPIDPVEIINAATSPRPSDRLTRFLGWDRRGSPSSVVPGRQPLAKPAEPKASPSAASPALPPPTGGHPGLCSR